MTDVPERTRYRTTARETLVSAAIDHLSARGPAGVQPQDICRELGISKALVNYHFGTREGLIAEAMVAAYERHVDALQTTAASAGDDAMAQFDAWVGERLQWTASHRGVAAAIAFPQAALGRSTMDADLASRFDAADARAADQLRTLVRAALAQRGSDTDADAVARTAEQIGLATTGACVRIGGEHQGTRQTQDQPVLQQMRTLISELLA